jgi:hypothetical protein
MKDLRRDLEGSLERDFGRIDVAERTMSISIGTTCHHLSTHPTLSISILSSSNDTA